MPSALKQALVREVARRGGNLNDLATGILAERFGVPYTPTCRRSPLAGTSGVTLLRMPEALKAAIDAEAARRGAHANDVILQVLADDLAIPFKSNRRKEPMASTNGKANGRARSEDKVRVAIIGVWLESNRSAPVAHAQDFKDFYELEGEAILERAREKNPSIMGEAAAFVKTMDATGPWEPVPILLAGCHPHGWSTD